MHIKSTTVTIISTGPPGLQGPPGAKGNKGSPGNFENIGDPLVHLVLPGHNLVQLYTYVCVCNNHCTTIL